MSTYLSILSTDTKTVQLLDGLFQKTQLFLGYTGSNSEGLNQFIKKYLSEDHLLFMKPTKEFLDSSSPQSLKKLGNVEVIILGNELPNDLIGFIQENKISGFVNPKELTVDSIIQIDKATKDFGYFANEHIPQEYWTNRKPHIFPRPKPKFTTLEEEVLRLLCHNYSVKEICEHLSKNEPAVRAHITNIREKLMARTLMEVVIIAMANMWIPIDSDMTSSKSPFL